MGIEGERPKRPHDHLGIDVEVDRALLENDQWAQRTLEDIGKTLTKAASPEHVYMGSIAIHFCRTSGNIVGKRYEIANVMQWQVSDMSEGVINAGLSNLITEFKRQMGREHKTTDKKDRRGEGNT